MNNSAEEIRRATASGILFIVLGGLRPASMVKSLISAAKIMLISSDFKSSSADELFYANGSFRSGIPVTISSSECFAPMLMVSDATQAVFRERRQVWSAVQASGNNLFQLICLAGAEPYL